MNCGDVDRSCVFVCLLEMRSKAAQNKLCMYTRTLQILLPAHQSPHQFTQPNSFKPSPLNP